MSTTTPQVTLPKVGPASRRFGYVMAILVNAAMLFVANSVLDWGWPPFLTEDFGQVLWLIDLSLLASIAVNSMYLGYDPPWFKSVCQIGLNLITIVVTIRMPDRVEPDHDRRDDTYVSGVPVRFLCL